MICYCFSHIDPYARQLLCATLKVTFKKDLASYNLIEKLEAHDVQSIEYIIKLSADLPLMYYNVSTYMTPI